MKIKEMIITAIMSAFIGALAGLPVVLALHKNPTIYIPLSALVGIVIGILAQTAFGFFFFNIRGHRVKGFLAIVLVIATELFNSALERLCDYAAGGKKDVLIGQAKDMAAAGVLTAAVFARERPALRNFPSEMLMRSSGEGNRFRKRNGQADRLTPPFLAPWHMEADAEGPRRRSAVCP